MAQKQRPSKKRLGPAGCCPVTMIRLPSTRPHLKPDAATIVLRHAITAPRAHAATALAAEVAAPASATAQALGTHRVTPEARRVVGLARWPATAAPSAVRACIRLVQHCSIGLVF